MFTRTRRILFPLLLLSVMPVSLLSVVPASAQSNTARSEIVFPFFVMTRPATLSSTCECWRTTFEVLNPHQSAITMQLTAFDTSGAMLSNFSDTILANRSKTIYLPEDVLFPPGTSKTAVAGWVWIAASLPVIARQRITHYQLVPLFPFPTVQTLSEIVKTPPLQTRREVIKMHYHASRATNTGIAIAVPAPAGSPPVRAKLILRWGLDAKVVAERELIIPPNSQVVAFLTELLPDSLNLLTTFDVVGGTLEMTFDRDVYVTAIEFSPRLFDGLVPEMMEEPLAGTVPPVVSPWNGTGG